MNPETAMRHLAKLDALMELEMQEMTEFLINRRARLDSVLSLLDEVPDTTADELSNAHHDTLCMARALKRILDTLPPYIPNK